jgi:hypothetical protein
MEEINYFFLYIVVIIFVALVKILCLSFQRNLNKIFPHTPPKT